VGAAGDRGIIFAMDRQLLSSLVSAVILGAFLGALMYFRRIPKEATWWVLGVILLAFLVSYGVGTLIVGR
jgi:hypothetical protein